MDPSSLYPKPQAGPLANMSLGDLINTARGALQLQGDQAVGKIMQENIDPNTGQFNPQGALQQLRANPAASFVTPRATQDILARQQQQQQLDVAKNAIAANELGAIADNPTDGAVNQAIMRISTALGPQYTPSRVRAELFGAMPQDMAGRRAYIANLAKMSIGAAGMAAREEGTPLASGAPTTITAGQRLDVQRMPGAVPSAAMPGAMVGPAAVAAPGGGMVSGLPPGAGEARRITGEAGAQAGVRLRLAADDSMTRKGMLGNLEEDLHNFTSGPGAEWQKVAKAWANRNVPMPAGWQFDPKSIASQEAFAKQAGMLAQQQFAAIGGTGTDAKFSSAFETNPNEALSQLGNKGIIRLLKGNEDAIQAKFKAWQQWKKSFGPESYDEFSDDFNRSFDPRVFQFKYLTPKERQAYIDRMDPRDRGKFIEDLTAARKRGWTRAGE